MLRIKVMQCGFQGSFTLISINWNSRDQKFNLWEILNVAGDDRWIEEADLVHTPVKAVASFAVFGMFFNLILFIFVSFVAIYASKVDFYPGVPVTLSLITGNYSKVLSFPYLRSAGFKKVMMDEAVPCSVETGDIILDFGFIYWSTNCNISLYC